jgi:PAS domain S-box-containing protein
VQLFSAGAEEVFGWRAEEVIGAPLDRFLPSRYRGAHSGHIRQFGETGVSMRQMGGERVLAGLRKSGEEFPIEARISQLDVNGEKFYTVIIRDVTERTRAEGEREELLRRERDSRAAAEAASRAKDEFLATISHELRTPLSPILAWARMLRQRALGPAKVEHALMVIERCALSQAQIIEDLLDVSRIIEGKLRLQLQTVDLRGVIRDALDAVRPSAELKGVVLVEEIGDAGAVSGDPERLQQVVWNLLSNAVKFTPAGGRVRVALAGADWQVEIVVSDTGEGIAPGFLPYAFERFRQADSSPTRVHGGLGLGLAIVRHIVELHGGTVAAASPGPGRGTTFTVRLPRLAGARPEAAPAGVPAGREGAVRGRPATPASLEGLRLLVVDDEPDACEVLREILTASGAEVRTAESAPEGLAILEQWPVDVLVTDIGMPGEDGYAFVRVLREREQGTGRRLPAVALTAYARVEDRMRALGAGFQMHVAKPVEPDELVSAVAALAEAFGRSADRTG